MPIDEDNFQIVYQIPMQFALQLIHFLFVFFEDIFGLVSLRVLAQYQIARFHYKQFDGAQGLSEKDSGVEMDWLYNLEKMNDINMKTRQFQVRYFLTMIIYESN